MTAYTPLEDKKNPTWYVIPGINGYLANKKGFIMRISDKKASLGHFDGRYYKNPFVNDPTRIPPKEYVHRLIARAFLGINLDPDIIVNHKNGNKRDNVYTNLEYITISMNLKHAYDLGLKLPTRKGYHNW
jgi:hypothetical protein